MLYFFLSYAHGENDDLVSVFFEDLSAEVRTYTGTDPRQQVGFLDNDALRAGAAWPPELIDALSTCRTLIALCSPRYFLSLPCGKEWTVFRWRLEAYAKAALRRAPALIPLFWVPTDPPAHLGDLQHRDRQFGNTYDRHGLRQLMRISTHRNAYLELVTALALRISEIHREHAIPELNHRPDFHAVPSAFHPDDLSAPHAGSEPPAEPAPRPVAATPPAEPRKPPRRPILTYDTDPHDDHP